MKLNFNDFFLIFSCVFSTPKHNSQFLLIFQLSFMEIIYEDLMRVYLDLSRDGWPFSEIMKLQDKFKFSLANRETVPLILICVTVR
jgi:hypothetical protein